MTPTAAENKKSISKSGIALPAFETVTLYKDVDNVPAVTSMTDALDRVGNDEAKLLKIIEAGLQEESEQAARASADGWTDAEGKVFDAPLVNSEDLNPIVLQFAKLNYDYDVHQANSNADGKREAKKQAIEDIKGMPKVLEGLTRKATQRMTAKG